MSNTREHLILKTMRIILSEKRKPSIRALMRIFAIPGPEAATREKISKVILRGTSRDLFLDIGKGICDLSTGAGADNNQRQLLEDALSEAKKRAAALSPPDTLMTELIDRVDIALLCSIGGTLRDEIRKEAEERVGGNAPAGGSPAKKKKKQQ